MKNIEIWKNNRELQELFKELGLELLPHNSPYIEEKKDKLIREGEGCRFYNELVDEIFDSSMFLVKSTKNNIYGYKEHYPITLMSGSLFYMSTKLSILEEILMNQLFNKKSDYTLLREKLTHFSIELREYEELMALRQSSKNYINLDNDLSDRLDICKYGRTLIEKEIKVSKEEFLEWKSPRYGTQNPTRVVSKVWEYAVQSREGAYWINEKFKGPSAYDSSACWTFDRLGKSVTFMPDGREIHIAGEHEDFYDPDFYIYNDVVVVNPDESIEFYNYPKELFLPTDFHSATLVDDKIVIIGNLGYSDNIEIGKTQIMLLDTNSYVLSEIEVKGLQPGWIHQHLAVLSGDKKSIIISKGEIWYADDKPLLENINEWKLDLTTWQWEQLTDKQWRRFEFRREDEKLNRLFNLRQALFALEAGWEKDYKKELKSLKKKLNFEPDVAILKELYLPDIEHKVLENETHGDERKIEINGVVVRYNEDMHSIIMTVEGNLESDIIENINRQVAQKFSLLEGEKYTIRELGIKEDSC